jgi:flagellar operon protein
MISQIQNNIAAELLKTQIHGNQNIPSAPSAPKAVPGPGNGQVKSEFYELLKAGSEGITFSKHAQKRLSSREIELGEKEMSRLKEVISRLESKGAKESLVLMKNEGREDYAFVVSVKNRTVITALSENMMKENIFTNIDSTVVLS